MMGRRIIFNTDSSRPLLSVLHFSQNYRLVRKPVLCLFKCRPFANTASKTCLPSELPFTAWRPLATIRQRLDFITPLSVQSSLGFPSVIIKSTSRHLPHCCRGDVRRKCYYANGDMYHGEQYGQIYGRRYDAIYTH